jgi:serine/threonine-protein kinase
VHRDLKPANVMIDGHGRVRITDFGMAIVMEDETQTREIAGTPAYMAPEQLAGKGATVRSDIYALGLILYELCSGKRAFTAGTLAELREQKANHTPRSVSDIRIDVDPNLERLVTRCIDRDPRGRPASVAQITAALPGGDPLAAAVRAGETPSPEMVAAAGLKEGIQPAAGIALLAFVVLGILALTGMSQALSLPAGQSQEVLTDRVRDLIKDFGYDVRGADRAFGYSSDTTLTALVTRYGPDKAWELWSKAKFDSARFWYRESPAPIVHREILSPAVSFSDPDLSVTGEIRVEVNAQGQLRRFEALPPAADAPESSSAPQEVWSVLFSEAGLDLSRFSPAEAPWRPFLHADTWAAWEGARLDAPEIPIRVEAAAYAGKPVYFRVKGPWSNPAKPTSRDRWTVVSVLIAVGAVFIGAISLVRRNARLGRGDRRGATRLAFLILGLSTASWILREHHVASIAELILLLSFAREALFMAVAIWLLYMAIEPVIRRRWPESLISWTRLLAGEWRDPLVGRDILVGCAAGVTFGVLGRLRTLTTQWFGGRAFDIVIVGPWHGGRAGALVASFLDIGGIVALALGFLVAFFLLQKLLRKNWITVSVLGLLLATTVSMLDRSWLGFVQTPFIVLLFAVLITRFGLLALVISLFVSSRLNTALTFDVSEWYFPVGLATALFVFALSFAALRISLGGARLLQDTDD